MTYAAGPSLPMNLIAIGGVGMSRQAWFLLSVVVSLVAVGLVFLYSATAIRCDQARIADPLFFFRKQLVWAIVSFAAMFVAAQIPTKVWMKSKWALLAVTFVLLALVFVPGVGVERGWNGARRWLHVSGWVLQPSELAKLALAVFLCAYAAENPERLRSFFRGFLPSFGVLGAACAMIAIEPDVGTAGFLALVFGLLLFTSGVRLVHLAPAVLVVGTVAGVFLYRNMQHVQARIATYQNPDLDPLGKGLQVKQSLIALGSGGMWGEGLGRSTQKLYYLPEVHADFLFPVIGEEMGYVGSLGVLLLYVLIGVAGWRIARRAATPFGFLFSSVVTWIIMLQAAMNVAVVTSTVPPKGIPLPLMSFGGSSLFFTLIGVGILVRIANEGERECSASSLPVEAPADICIPASR